MALVSGALVFYWVVDTQTSSQNFIRSDVQSIGTQQFLKIDSQFRNKDVNLLNKLIIRVKNSGIETIPSGSYEFYFNELYCAKTKLELELKSTEIRLLEFNDIEIRQSYISNDCIKEAASASFRYQSMPFSIKDPTGKITTSFTLTN